MAGTTRGETVRQPARNVLARRAGKGHWEVRPVGGRRLLPLSRAIAGEEAGTAPLRDEQAAEAGAQICEPKGAVLEPLDR